MGLGDLPGGSFGSRGYGISSDGLAVVGYSTSASGNEGFRWTQAGGMRRLYDVLVNDCALSLPGWTLVEARGVSGDGKVIVGVGTNPSGQTEGWIANLRVATLSSTPGDGGTLSFGYVLVGYTGTQSLAVANTGDLHTTPAGTFPSASGEFAPGSIQGFSLAQGAGTSRNYTYTPTAHGPQQATVRADFLNGSSDGANLPQILDQIITGTGVGPVFSSSLAPGTTLGFGDVILGGQATQTLTISNLSTDGVFVDALTGLSLVSFVFGGPDGAAFSVAPGVPGSAVSEGGFLDVEVQFAAQGPAGAKSATLTLTTDQGAAFGGGGAQFAWNLTGNVVEAE
ncbi:MAG: choice-of-anchor D domain-containing protein [Planctomycetes bacterium]|nr:choice-of-anchor D domain-containing protein [Planctomycetota bacterium]